MPREFRPEMGIVKPPSDAIGYKVVVSPANFTMACWDFIVLIHRNDAEIATMMVKEICEGMLEQNDSYSIFTVGHGVEEDILDGIGVLSFNPENHDSFEWICVPSHWKH